MKLSFALWHIAASALVVKSAVGHPHDLKRDIVTEVTYTTVTVNEVLIYVDENGVPYATSTLDDLSVIQTTLVEVTSSVSQAVNATPQPELPLTSASPVIAAPTSDTEVSATLLSSGIPAFSGSTAALNEPAVTTSVVGIPITSAPVPEPTSAPVEPPTSAAPESVTVENTTPVPAPASSTPASASEPTPSAEATASAVASPSAQPQANDDRLPIGIAYDPFKAGPNCKDADQIASEFETMAKYGIVRIYAMDCNIIPLAVQNAKAHNIKLMAGIWTTNDGSSENVTTVVDALSDAVKTYNGGDWSIISLVSVENEQVNSHQLTASAVVDVINKARSYLRFAGYSGPVGAVETAPAMIGNPAICQNSDIVMANIHAFFDPNTRAEDAGTFVQGQVQQVSNACGGKRVVVTESGWPHQGDSHDLAVASKDAQTQAINSLLKAFDHDLFLFSGFDSNWKTDWAGSYDAEKYWGIF